MTPECSADCQQAVSILMNYQSIINQSGIALIGAAAFVTWKSTTKSGKIFPLIAGLLAATSVALAFPYHAVIVESLLKATSHSLLEDDNAGRIATSQVVVISLSSILLIMAAFFHEGSEN